MAVRRIAADVGGTFTDIALLDEDGRLATCKLPSSPPDFADAVVAGALQLLGDVGSPPAAIEALLHGSTIATNLILEHKGAKTALITTEGFRDVLELRRIRVPSLYEPLYVKPQPLVPRHLRLEVAERVLADGTVLKPLDLDSVHAAIERLAGRGIEAIAVCLLHSYVNPAHERIIGEMLAREMPGCFVSLSVDVLPQKREYERTSTTVINSYIGPPVGHYVEAMVRQMHSSGIGGRLMMMQSNGGILDAGSVVRAPAQIVECGPAAGVIGAEHFGRRNGYPDLITLDMGGTTAKASIIEDGSLAYADEYEVGGSFSSRSFLAGGGGYALKLPVVDVLEIGAGGGSIAWLDKGGSLKIGPQSSGAVPGPACYGKGNLEPTVTDANLILGYLNPTALAGGSVPVQAELAGRAVLKIAEALSCDLLAAAYGIHTVANANMMRVVKAVTTYRGRDPRDFTLFAYGGNGGVHAVDLARVLQIRRVVVPPGAGVFSAIGLLYSRQSSTWTQPFAHVAAAFPAAEAESKVAAMTRRIEEVLGAERTAIEFRYEADVRFLGQAFEITVPFSAPPYDEIAVARLAETFAAEHLARYGHAFAGRFPVEIVNLRLTGTLLGDEPPDLRMRPQVAGVASRRSCYFGPTHGVVDTPVIDREQLGESPQQGPIVIEEYEGTVVVPPDCLASRDGYGNIVIELPGSPVSSEPSMSTAIDPFQLEIIKSSFDTIADDMALTLMRTAHSGIVRDSLDFSTSICDAAGQPLAQGVCTPMQLGSFYDAMRKLISLYGGRIDRGDVFIFNDPYAADGQHLPDIYITSPIIHDGKLRGWSVTVAHHSDVGGIVAGSNAIGVSEIFQEGLRLPIVKLVEAGRPNEALWEVIRTNVRTPDKVEGDLQAQIAACTSGERELIALFTRYGTESVLRYADHLQDYAERLTRAELRDIPDGIYGFTDHLDGLGENPEPIVLKVKVIVEGDGVTVDWTGSSAQVRGGINPSFPFTKACAYTALRSVMRADVPNCHGFTRPIKVVAPLGSIMNPLFPAPSGARGITGFRMIDCLFGALAQAVPERVIADSNGGSTLPTIAGYRNGKAFVFCETFMGTWGGSASHDGQEGVPHLGANQSNVPIEMIETDYPLRIERYGFLTDTGGPGRQRGGLGLVREYRLLAEEAILNVRSDKRSHPPHGLYGGKAGAPSFNIINPGEAKRILPVLMTEVEPLRRGDVYRHEMSGGGGYGDPLDRDPENVLWDVIEEKVSRDAARRDYGVVLADAGNAPEVDAVATAALRRQLREAARAGA